jgi:hypothetical protein
MLSRGFNGEMPRAHHATATTKDLLQVMLLPITALIVLMIGFYL